MAQLNSKNQEVELALLEQILKGQDDDGKISSQIATHLAADGISLQMLNEFDDFSLKETIDSWKLNTFNKKPFIIRGILLRGIKKLYNTNNNSTTTGQPSISRSKSRLQHVITEKELEMLEKLEKLEKSVRQQQEKWLHMINDTKQNDNINSNGDSKEAELELKSQEKSLTVQLVQNKIRMKIETTFNDLFKKMTVRREELIANMEKQFEEYESSQSQYTIKLESVLKTINDTKNTYDENCNKHNQTKAAIIARSQMNCEMIEKMIETFNNDDDLEQPLQEWFKKLDNIESTIGKELNYTEKQVNMGSKTTLFEFTWLGVDLKQASNPVIHTAMVPQAASLKEVKSLICNRFQVDRGDLWIGDVWQGTLQREYKSSTYIRDIKSDKDDIFIYHRIPLKWSKYNDNIVIDRDVTEKKQNKICSLFVFESLQNSKYSTPKLIGYPLVIAFLSQAYVVADIEDAVWEMAKPFVKDGKREHVVLKVWWKGDNEMIFDKSKRKKFETFTPDKADMKFIVQFDNPNNFINNKQNKANRVRYTHQF